MTNARSFALPETRNGGVEFVQYAKSILASRGDFITAIATAEATPSTPARTVALLRAASTAGTTSKPGWAAELMDYKIAENGFVESLRQIGVFDRLFPDMRQLSLDGRVVINTVVAVASAVAEGAAKPVLQLSLTGQDIERLKCAAIMVISDELARSTTAAGNAMIASELRNAVIAGSDKLFLDFIQQGLTPIASSGTDVAAVNADVAALLAAVDTGSASRLAFVLPPDLAKTMSGMVASDGRSAFEITANGGTLANAPALVSDQLAADRVVLVDAAGIAAAAEPIALESARHASVEMSDSPAGNAAVVSLWQHNLTGLRGERLIGLKKLRNAVAVLSGVSWGVVTP